MLPQPEVLLHLVEPRHPSQAEDVLIRDSSHGCHPFFTLTLVLILLQLLQLMLLLELKRQLLGCSQRMRVWEQLLLLLGYGTLQECGHPLLLLGNRQLLQLLRCQLLAFPIALRPNCSLLQQRKGLMYTFVKNYSVV